MKRTVDHSTDRSLLRFADETRTHFAFLEAEGFHCVHSEETLVTFQSPEITIRIYHGRQSYEIGLEIESSLSPSEHYSFSALLRLVDPDQAKQYRNFCAVNAQGVSDGIRQLAARLRHCLASGILNNNQLFGRLKLQKQEMIDEYALDVQLQQARRSAETAWQKKDYATFIRHLEPLMPVLSALELKKVKFARKHL